jgi:hypothetical protein
VAPAGRFRARQATLPMGVLPDALQSKLGSTQGAASEPRMPARAPVMPSPRDQAAALAAREQKPGEPKLSASRLPSLEMPIADDEPTLLRASPLELFGETAPRSRAPMPTPVRELLGRQFEEGPRPDAPKSPAPKSPLPPRPPNERGSNERAPIDTFRATPEAKRSWFPESDSSVPPPPAPPPPASRPLSPPSLAVVASSPFASGGRPPTAPSPSSAFAAAANTPSAAPSPPPTFAQPPGPVTAAAVPLRAPVFAVAAPSFDEVAAFRSQKRRRVLIIIGALILIAVVVAGILLSGNAQPPPPPPPAQPVGEAAPPAAGPESTPPTTPNEPSPPGEPGATAVAANVNANSVTAQTTMKAPPLPGTPGTSPSAGSGDFADMFAEGAKQAKGEPGGHFDAAAAKNALDAELNEAARCREPGGPTGVTRVAVTFAPSGNVASATIAEPPFAGTSVGNCICEAMKRAHIKPFTGVPGNLTERISIR